MKKLLPLVTALIAPLLFLSLVGVVPCSASEEEESRKLMETATTPEDHIKVADYYEQQALRMEEEAKFHSSLADSYKSRGKSLLGLAKHCADLSKRYKEAAEDYKAMAFLHKKIAQEMRKE